MSLEEADEANISSSLEEDDKDTMYAHRRKEYESMEQWLNEHPDFVHDYFARKATRSMIDGWTLAHALAQDHSVVSAQPKNPNDAGSVESKNSSKHSSGNNTPVRKISAQEFERGGQILKPMVSTVAGTPTFLGPSLDNQSLTQQSKSQRKSRSELKALDERELLYELVMDICNDLDVRSLCHKILQNVSLLLNADRCSLFLVQHVKGSIKEKCLVSELFDVTIHSTLQECLDKGDEIRVPWGTGIIGYVAKTGEAVNIPDAYADHRFNGEVDRKTGYKTHSVLSMPITDMQGEVVGVAQAINKISFKDEPFDEHDEKVFSSYLAFCGIGIRNALLYERSQLENRRNELLLDLARIIFEEQSNVAALIHKIMLHTQSLMQCERCQVLLVDDHNKGIFSQVFDLQASDFENDDSYHREGTQEPRFPINIGITGYVAAHGETLNIPDAYEDERFDSKVDEQSNFRTRQILCMPIRNAQGQVLGVSQLINKMDGTVFNQNDVNLFEAFAIFCGLGINNTQIYERTMRAMAKQRIALEVLSYHAVAPVEEVQKYKRAQVQSAATYHLLDYNFSDFTLDDHDTVRATLRLFMDLDLLERFHMSYDVLCRWVLSVKKNYRDVTYHNWRHAFNVTQTMFTMIMRGGMKNVLGDVQSLALLVGCLCHDLDHRGTNNQFQIKTMTPLAQLYSTSTMEHHHFDHCIMILNTKGNEILANLNQTEYEKVIRTLEGAILSTDLALYFRYRGEFFNLLDSGKADWGNDIHKSLLRSMMMTACDVSAITKPWEVQQQVAELIASEFFDQGDLEKKQLHITPSDMMNREKKYLLPTMQVAFIDSICMPIYQAFSRINPQFEPMRQGCESNRAQWLRLSHQNTKQQKDEDARENSHKDDGEHPHPQLHNDDQQAGTIECFPQP